MFLRKSTVLSSGIPVFFIQGSTNRFIRLPTQMVFSRFGKCPFWSPSTFSGAAGTFERRDWLFSETEKTCQRRFWGFAAPERTFFGVMTFFRNGKSSIAASSGFFQSGKNARASQIGLSEAEKSVFGQKGFLPVRKKFTNDAIGFFSGLQKIVFSEPT